MSTQYSGWVYHIGVNSVGHDYCHLRFLTISGKSAAMYKRDPHDNPEIEPIRKGVVSPTLVCEELGRQRMNYGVDIYVLRLYNPMDQNMKGKIACATPGEARKWLEAFEEASLQAGYDMMRGVNWNENEINFDGHRPRLRRYVYGLGKYLRISKNREKGAATYFMCISISIVIFILP